MTKPILFLDIDGVLNTGRGTFLPQNRRLAEERRQGASQYDIMPRIAFDPVSVALLNYLLERADAQLVVHSSWASYFRDRLPEVLAAQGVATDHVYETFTATAPPSFDLDTRFAEWIEGDGTDPAYAILDDSVLRKPHLIDHHVQTDPSIGLTTGDVRVALVLLGVREDRDLGLYPVSDDDWKRIRGAHETGRPGDHVAALRWLHDDRPGEKTRSAKRAAEEDLEAMVRDAIARFGVRALDNIDLERLATPQQRAWVVGRALMDKGGLEGFKLGRQLVKKAEALADVERGQNAARSGNMMPDPDG